MAIRPILKLLVFDSKSRAVKHPERMTNCQDIYLLQQIEKYFDFLPIGLSQFIESLNEQFDFQNEVRNLQRIRNNLQALDFVEVPEVYCYGENFIIESYLEGKRFSQLNEPQYT